MFLSGSFFPCRPREWVRLAWGSRSTSKTVRPMRRRAAARLVAVVVFPAPPFWIVRDMMGMIAFAVCLD